MRQFIKWLPRFREAYRQLDTLAERESWPRAEIESLQLRRLNELWQHASHHVPYYHQLRDDHDLPPQFSDLAEFRRRMPVLRKEELRSQNSAFLSSQAKRGRWYRTSGSTGIPLRAFRAREAHLETLRAKYRFYQMWGHGLFDPMVWLWSNDGGGPGWTGRIATWRQDWADWARNRMRLQASELCPRYLREYLSRIARFRPTAIYGYSRATHLLAREALAAGFHCDSLKLVNVSGEAATGRMIDEIEQAFGVPAVMEYGCIEFGTVAVEWPDRSMRVREDMVLAETLARADGRYDLLLTTLNNSSFPLIRYEVGDVTDAPLTQPDSGFSVLPAVCGRTDDLLLSRGGHVIDATYVDELFEYDHFDAVRRYRVHQQTDGMLSVTLELSDPARPPDTARIRQQLEELVEGYPVQVRFVDSIEQTAAGKLRVVTSDLATPENLESPSAPAGATAS